MSRFHRENSKNLLIRYALRTNAQALGNGWARVPERCHACQYNPLRCNGCVRERDSATGVNRFCVVRYALPRILEILKTLCLPS
ncbi:MAG: hypothetical protein VB111_01445 [Clostridiaceae bacterium]|nr:hypothetical protein [Clostridiaceae bacterium]